MISLSKTKTAVVVNRSAFIQLHSLPNGNEKTKRQCSLPVQSVFQKSALHCTIPCTCDNWVCQVQLHTGNLDHTVCRTTNDYSKHIAQQYWLQQVIRWLRPYDSSDVQCPVSNQWLDMSITNTWNKVTDLICLSVIHWSFFNYLVSNRTGLLQSDAGTKFHSRPHPTS